MKQLFRSVLLVAAVVSSGTVFADSLKSVLDVYLVVTEEKDGKKVETLVPSDEAEPGALLEYVLTYTNEGEDALTGFKIKSPIPSNTIFVGSTQKSSVKSDFTVSIDGGETFEQEPVKRTVVKDGKPEEIVIPPSEYNTLAWGVSEALEPQSAMTMRYRVIIQ